MGKGLGATVRGAWYDEGKQIDLEAERELRLKKMKLTNDSVEHNQQRQQQKENYQDQQREKALELVKSQYKALATNNIDEAILDSGKSDYDKLNKVLTNNTEGNVNLDIKKGLEQTLGGTIIKVRHPAKEDVVFADDESDTSEKEIAPDQVAIDYITPAGEHLTKHMSALQLGVYVGTPKRVGHQKFVEHMDGSKIQRTPTDIAKELSVSFDGKIEDLTQNLMVAATVGKDPNAEKLLNHISEINAKSGDSLIQALTKEWVGTKDPKEKKAIMEKIKDVTKIMDRMKTAKSSTSKDNVKEKLNKDYYEALQSGNQQAIDEASKRIKDFNALTAKPIKPTNPTTYDKQQEHIQQADKKIAEDISVDKITRGEVTPAKISKLLTDRLADTKSPYQQATIMPIYHKLVTQDQQGKHELDLSHANLRVGSISEGGARLLDSYKAIQLAGGAKTSSSQAKESIGVLSMGVTVMSNASNMAKEYDNLKAQGYFKDGQSLGVVQGVQDGIFKKLGNWLDGTDEGYSKAKTAMTAQMSVGDQIDALEKKKAEKGLGRTERDRLSDLRDRFGMNKKAQWDTQTYLVLKNMLKALSGQGVTNQELESFKEAFSGKNFDSLDAVVRQLTNSSLQTMSQANLEYNKLVDAGLPYTATKGVLDMRSAGEYLLEKNADFDVNKNLSFKPNMRLPFKHTQGYQSAVSSLSTAIHSSEAQTKSMMSEIYNYAVSGNTQNFFTAHKIPYSMQKKYKAVADVVSKLNSSWEQAQAMGRQQAQATDSSTPSPNGDTEFKDLTSAHESGGDYETQSSTSTAYGKYQIIEGKYKDIAKATGKSVEYLKTPKGQEEAMNYLTKFYDEQLKKYGVPISNINRYTVHQLGEGRAKRYFSNTLTSKDYTLMWKNLGKPNGLYGKNEEILQAWNNKFRKEHT